MIRDGRGEHMKSISKGNREVLRAWLEKHENPTIKEICDALGLNYRTVRKHVDAIKRGE